MCVIDAFIDCDIGQNFMQKVSQICDAANKRFSVMGTNQALRSAGYEILPKE